ncbi:MAG: PEP-CTERM sorting domain-containing protein [Armatimonadetes bacterium]|nr:PEP-CTERM sorting domain-containing protein [Armatimonadota bacterium]
MNSPCLSKALRSAFFVLGASALSSGAFAAGLVFNPTFVGFSADQQATIQDALNDISGRYTDNVTVNLKFTNVNSGLGGSSQSLFGFTYGAFKSLLAADAKSALDNTAVASLPGGNPFGARGVALTRAQIRALGQSIGSDGNGFDCYISLNASLCFTRSQGAQVGKYDLHAVAQHEIDESMGIGGPASLIGSGFINTFVGAADLFRYSAAGVRTNLNSNSVGNYLSYDNGVTKVRDYNNGLFGGDYADWASDANPHVQDAFGTSGQLINYSNEEVMAGDGIGWDVKSVPEPTTMGLLGLGAIAAYRRRKKA